MRRNISWNAIAAIAAIRKLVRTSNDAQKQFCYVLPTRKGWLFMHVKRLESATVNFFSFSILEQNK